MKQIRILPLIRNVQNCSSEELYHMLLLDKEEYEIVIDLDNFNYILVVISHVIADKKLYKWFRDVYSTDKVVIFYGDEAISPDMNIFDYAITFDDALFMQDRIFRRPTILNVWGGGEIQKESCLDFERAESEYLRRRFCNFIYSNAYANETREAIFHSLSVYQRVDALGKVLHNYDAEVTRDRSDWFRLSIKQKENYRFSIAAENSSFSGYTSEKLISSFLAHSIPIYWGNPNVEKEFNGEAFINCHKFESLDEVRDEVIRINENKELWCYMVAQPWRTKKQISEQEEQIKAYKTFIRNIFDKDCKDAKRVYQGAAVWNYIDFFFNKFN